MHNSWGWLGDQSGGKNNWTPVVPSSQSTYPEFVDNHDVLLLTVLRPQGFYGLLAGGSLSQGVTARLVHISNQGDAPLVYAGVSAGGAVAYLQRLCVYSLPWEDETLATTRDTFDREDSTNLDSPMKGSAPWRSVFGSWEIHNQQLVCRTAGLVSTDIRQAD